MAKVSKCPKCGEQIDNTMEKCPNCGVKLSWQGTQKKTRKDETSDFLLKTHYIWKTVNYIFPWVSVVLLILNKDYENNINSSKVNAFKDLKKNTIVLAVIHAVIILGLLIYGLTMIKNAQSGAGV